MELLRYVSVALKIKMTRNNSGQFYYVIRADYRILLKPSCVTV